MTNTQSLTPLVAIIDSDEQDLMKTMQILVTSGKVQVVGIAKRPDEIAHVMGGEPDIVLFNVGGEMSNMADIVLQILDISPRCQVILTAAPDAEIDMVKAMQLGARGLLRKPLLAESLLAVINNVFHAEVRRLQRIDEQTKLRVTQGRAGEVITVFSPK